MTQRPLSYCQLSLLWQGCSGTMVARWWCLPVSCELEMTLAVLGEHLGQ